MIRFVRSAIAFFRGWHAHHTVFNIEEAARRRQNARHFAAMQAARIADQEFKLDFNLSQL